MPLKSDRWIRKMAMEHEMINPFAEKQVRDHCISFGLSSYGYDLRVADEFKIFTNVNCAMIDPKKFDERSFVTVQSDCAEIPETQHQAQEHQRQKWQVLGVDGDFE